SEGTLAEHRGLHRCQARGLASIHGASPVRIEGALALPVAPMAGLSLTGVSAGAPGAAPARSLLAVLFAVFLPAVGELAALRRRQHLRGRHECRAALRAGSIEQVERAFAQGLDALAVDHVLRELGAQLAGERAMLGPEAHDLRREPAQDLVDPIDL